MLTLIVWVGLSKLDLKLVDVYGGGTYMCCCLCISLRPAVGVRVCPGRCIEFSLCNRITAAVSRDALLYSPHPMALCVLSQRDVICNLF